MIGSCKMKMRASAALKTLVFFSLLATVSTLDVQMTTRTEHDSLTLKCLVNKKDTINNPAETIKKLQGIVIQDKEACSQDMMVIMTKGCPMHWETLAEAMVTDTNKSATTFRFGVTLRWQLSLDFGQPSYLEVQVPIKLENPNWQNFLPASSVKYRVSRSADMLKDPSHFKCFLTAYDSTQNLLVIDQSVPSFEEPPETPPPVTLTPPTATLAPLQEILPVNDSNEINDLKEEVADLQERLDKLEEKLDDLDDDDTVDDTLASLMSLAANQTAFSVMLRLMRWPEGTYGLLQPASGCPNTVGTWETGSRSQHTESSYWGTGNHASDDNHLQVPTFYESSNRKFARQHFCTKTFLTTAPIWPEGSYCINKKGDCPSGFTPGMIRWDDEDTRHFDIKDGLLPDGEYDRDTSIYYCCRSDGNVTVPMILPIADPFYLYRHGGQCQEVASMNVTNEFMNIDTENDEVNADGLFGEHPDATVKNVKLELCYYESML